VQHWYVYYKVAPHERDATVALIRRMQERIAGASQVKVRLLERTERAEATTMMEVYEDIDQAATFAATIEDAVRAAGLPAALVAARRTERFQDV
jgi:hypothetical protein